MKSSNVRTVVCASVIATAAAFGVGACGSSDSSTATATSTTAAVSSSTTTSAAASSTAKNKLAPTPEADVAGPNYTIADYIAEAGIVETPIHMGDPGAPVIDLPFPDGWENAGDSTPDYAYGAIVYNGPETDEAQYQPSIIALVSKLDGNVDPQKLIDAAGGELQNLPGYVEVSPGETSTLGGFPAYHIAGTYTQDGMSLLSAQETVVIPAADGMYVMQINIDGAESQQDLLIAAVQTIDQQTTITV
ncbi:LpqN/LpqT family lipoprotein [Rhodococcoides trifolii]|uniref:LpqN/LpqT family lipoprotein n=1 Tax=Rhodococcoides trifolii TaxID=908250 RepID=UPI00166EBF3C|nr:LpqN/LpqT family lipoprotein [Rhodococcus trifolii]